MAEVLPRPNLNPAAAPWARAIQRGVGNADDRLTQLEDRYSLLLDAVLQALRPGTADAEIYRRDGVLVPGDQDEFTLYKGTGADAAEDADGSAFSMIDFLGARLAIRSVGAETFQMRQDFLPNFASLTYGTGLRETDRQIIHTGLQFDIDGRGLPHLALVQTGNGQPLIEAGYDDQSKAYVRILGQTPGTGSGTVADATHQAKGIVRLATDAEVGAGANDATAVTPKQLRAATAGAGKSVLDYWRGEWVQP